MSIIDISNVTTTTTAGTPDPDTTPILAAVETARTEVAGYAVSNGTRQAVEALCDAVEALTA